MAGTNRPESFSSFVEENKSSFPVVVEVGEGIYGSFEKDSEVRDFSNGDILRLVSVKEQVNITFDGVYSEASKKGLITIDRNFSGAQFEVISHFKDGHVYETLEQLSTDFPEFVRAVKAVDFGGGAKIKAGDRLKLLKRNTKGMLSVSCKNIRTGLSIQLSGNLKQSFAKKKDKSHHTVNLDEIYCRLPQRVRMVFDEGQIIRGRFHGIPGLDAHFDGEMNLSKIEIVEASPWENPNRMIRIPMHTDVHVYPRKDWGDKIGGVVDIHELAKEATPQSKKVAVVVDQESTVSGCQKDTILAVCGSQTLDYAVAKGRDNVFVLIPKNYPSLFKIVVKSWCTVEDLLQANMRQEVHVGTTYKVKEESMDTLYEHDVVNFNNLELEQFYGKNDEYEVVKMDRSRSLSGKVGTITVPTYAKANFYENPTLLGDNLLSQVLAQKFPLQITLSRPNVSSEPQELDADDDLLLRLSPLEIIAQCRISVATCKLLNPGQQMSGDPDLIVIPEIKKLALRSITQPTVKLDGKDKLPQLITKVIRISEREAQKLSDLDELTYEPLPPHVPQRTVHHAGSKPPPRPYKSVHVIEHILHKGTSQPSPPFPPKRQSSPLPSPSSPPPPAASRRHASFHGFFAKKKRDKGHGQPDNISCAGVRANVSSALENPYAEVLTDDSEDDYERPDIDYEKPDIKQSKAKGLPPKDGNILAYGLSDTIQLLEYLKVSRRMVDTFKSKRIDGTILCNLAKRGEDESVQTYLGVDDIKDWLALMYFINKSV